MSNDPGGNPDRSWRKLLGENEFQGRLERLAVMKICRFALPELADEKS